jgi:hypothetical protein
MENQMDYEITYINEFGGWMKTFRWFDSKDDAYQFEIGRKVLSVVPLWS